MLGPAETTIHARRVIMRRVRQLLCTLLMIGAAQLPVSASAYHVLSPGLATALVNPPEGFVGLVPARLSGPFTAQDYAATSASNATETENSLKRNGFVDGFGATWVEVKSGHVLFEFVIAFEGGKGARNWLASEEAADKTHIEYQHSNVMTGIDRYYGVHHVDPFTHLVMDAFYFVKGNDMFGVAFTSTKDDVLSLATKQVRSQYDFAPPETLPRGQWPEYASKNDYEDLVRILGVVLFVALVAGVGAIVVLRVRRLRPRMSPDGNHWWDGKHWIDSVSAVPAFAERTADGAYWWDGLIWRPVPQIVPPPTSGA
jgi:hypothetical protein